LSEKSLIWPIASSLGNGRQTDIAFHFITLIESYAAIQTLCCLAIWLEDNKTDEFILIFVALVANVADVTIVALVLPCMGSK